MDIDLAALSVDEVAKLNSDTAQEMTRRQLLIDMPNIVEGNVRQYASLPGHDLDALLERLTAIIEDLKAT